MPYTTSPSKIGGDRSFSTAAAPNANIVNSFLLSNAAYTVYVLVSFLRVYSLYFSFLFGRLSSLLRVSLFLKYFCVLNSSNIVVGGAPCIFVSFFINLFNLFTREHAIPNNYKILCATLLLLKQRLHQCLPTVPPLMWIGQHIFQIERCTCDGACSHYFDL